MKNLSWAVLGLLLCVPFTGAETIDSVSFNPARLGRYETLKVSDQLTTKGGIEANAVTVQSGGTVSVNNAGNYKFPATEVKGSVEMTSTDFKADTLNSRGTASFENKSSSAESKISTLNTSTADVRANILDLTSVTVPTGGSLTLGENAIPEPTQSCSNLRWVERTADDNYKYKVLAFGSCAGGEDDGDDKGVCTASKTTLSSEDYSSFSQAAAKDTCDKNAGRTNSAGSGIYNGTVTEALCDKGSCIDYYFSGKVVDKSTWQNSIEGPFHYSGNSSYDSTTPSPYNDPTFANYVRGKTDLPAASKACDDLMPMTRTEKNYQHIWNCRDKGNNAHYRCEIVTLQCKIPTYTFSRIQWKFTRS